MPDATKSARLASWRVYLMFRSVIVLATVAACVLWAGTCVFAQDDEYTLPPVKLKPDRPTTAKPIPPVSDERTSPPETTLPPPPPIEPPAPPPEPPTPPAVTPKAPPIEPPALPPEPPTPPVVTPKAPPVETPKVLPVAVPATPAAVPVKAPPKMPADLVLPPMPPDLRGGAPVDVAVPVKTGEIQKSNADAQMQPTVEADLSNLGEVGLADEVARSRKAYGRALLAMKEYYQSRANVAKIAWVDSELEAFNQIPKMQYLTVTERAGPRLQPMKHVEAADQLYKEAVTYKDYPALPPGKKEYLRQAIDKFQTIIEKYPDSDKIADAAFRLGEIYGGWYYEDYARAVQAYERCWQWDPKTPNPAIFNAAKIYDEKLKNRPKAVELYNRVMAESVDQGLINQARDRIKALTGR
jgi:TolA-binding protein